jgi:nitroimidazol reductase NimA-like FMN-containing flavoprotein (pyridoxamine 5'-phosphate oxidase superfamily)
LIEDVERIEAVEHTWERLISFYPSLIDDCSLEEIENKTILVKNSFIRVLRAHAWEIRLYT